MTRSGVLYVASLVAHAAIAIGVASLKAPRREDVVAIAVVEARREPKPADLPPPPAPPSEAPKPAAPSKAKAAPVPKPAQPEPVPATPPAKDAPDVPEFGLSLGGAPGGGGLAVPAARPAPTATSTNAERVSKKVLAAAPAPDDACPEPAKKPKVLSITQPAYTPEARDARIAGKVRIEVTVDASGKVASARILEGLGHGLDDGALAAARGASFEPGTKCGKPSRATFVLAIRFSL